ncbi:endo-1,4-beta-xylanase, partial [Paenibacillus sp. 598K]|uniref:endo-1,4-beta-xylanase n=1 Tax=Paenibacillus sp. 598K TaxID=1117987 RepID=UPI001624CF18
TLQGNNLELLKQHHNVFTAENAMKPDAMYNNNREYTPNAAVSLVDKALAEGMKVHGHVLIWHGQSPEWLPTADPAGLDLETEGLSERDAALVRMKAHITRVVETFGDKVISWDVVNEAIRDNPSNPDDWRNALRMNEAAWNRAIGSDYIEMAFRYAKEALEKNGWDDVKLYYNDYNEDTRSKAIAIASMVKELNDKYAKEHPGKLLIDGIGMQAHYNSGTRIANVQWSLETFIDLGVEVSVSELDIQAGQGRVQTESEAKTQALQYAQLFQLYKKHADNIARVTFWGINDTASWRVETSPLIFNGRMQAKQAYYAVADPEAFLEEHGGEEVVVETKKSTASYGTPTIDGTVDAAWEKATALPVSRYLTAHNGAKGTARVLWDDDNLYVLVQVNSNLTLDKSSSAVHEHDSVEVFVDQKNVKSAAYEAGVGQYRVNFDNERSFNPDGIGANVTSATKVEGTNYTVELKIPLTEIDPKAEQEIGFDVQINDGESGARRSVATWNDGSGQGYNDPSVFGVLTLKSETTGGEPEVTVYHETFLNGKGDLVQQSGGAALTAVTGKSFEGNSDGAALHVANRSAGWHGADFDFEKMGLKKGQKYKVTVTGYVDEGVTVPAGAEAYLQLPMDSYPLLANESYVAGEAFALKGEFTYTDVFTKFRVQSNEGGQTVPFYIGDVKVTGPADGGGDGEPGESIAFYDFEDGVQGWSERDVTTATVAHTTEANATDGGSHSLKVTVNAQYA